MPPEARIDAKGRAVCGALKRNKQPCQTRILFANGRCRIHGGPSPFGANSPNFKTGLYSEYLPDRLIPRYEVSLSDPELLSARNDIALTQGLILDRLIEIKSAQQQPDMNDVLARVQKISSEWRTWEWTRMEREMRELLDVITVRRDERVALREVRELIKEKAALQQQENRRLVDLRQTITLEQAIIMAQALVGIVRAEIMPLPDGLDHLKAITGKFREVMTLREIEPK